MKGKGLLSWFTRGILILYRDILKIVFCKKKKKAATEECPRLKLMFWEQYICDLIIVHPPLTAVN